MNFNERVCECDGYDFLTIIRTIINYIILRVVYCKINFIYNS